ncbi:ribonuclease-like storage protein [Lycium barbarum]|uniref:ribonuclease-like storage protein n=1 Tax=Lycium barbarum TaxID=112863 RepID=UPI00293E8884|nr:ribonuclease-like storage protein [Lycium barbarum]
MVLQWPTTFCGKKGNYCNDPSLMQFTLHGLWPANSTGYTLSCFPPTTNTNTWLSDQALVRDLHTYWYSLIRGRADFALWKHEWEKHGYCASQTITDTEYFKGAVRFSKDPLIDDNAVLKKLRSNGITPSNSRVYKDTAIRNLFPNKNIYISCKKNATNHLFLHEIYFCLDPRLGNFLPCPTSPLTRSCGFRKGSFNIIFPIQANPIYGSSWREDLN